jgi:hypothetical protein
MSIAGVAGSVVKSVKEVGVLPLIGDATNIVVGVSDARNARKEGNSVPVSIAKAVGSFAFYEMLGVWGFGYGGVKLAGSLGIAAAQNTTEKMRRAYGSVGKLGSGYFNMTEAGYTMRQRSLNAIRQNGLNTQSVLGNEARTYYRGSV